MAKLVDAPHSKCGEAAPHVGSSPTPPIRYNLATILPAKVNLRLIVLPFSFLRLTPLYSLNSAYFLSQNFNKSLYSSKLPCPRLNFLPFLSHFYSMVDWERNSDNVVASFEIAKAVRVR